MSGRLTITQLETKANEVRKDIVRMLEHAGSGHSAGPLGLADLVTALYFDAMNIDPARPDDPDRDIFMLSNGHCVPVQYAVMAHRGYFPVDELMTLRRLGTRLQGHPERTKLPGLENTSGPLGCGIGQGAGYAYALQYLDHQHHRWVYVVTGDGELDEGNIWESALFAGKYKLSQLIVFVDRNNIQIDGPTEDVMPLEDLRGKWESFGWHVQEIDGHNVESIIDAVGMAKAIENRPSVIITHTIPGKNVDFMEYNYKWHGIPPNKDQAKEALKELRTMGGRIRGEHE
ncbi:transketolase N-terminal domain protein [Candidatus Saccharimonas aalborgensis]|jgi:transketolase|uniref:Transketolase N-terminal domain protein n=1 Tax=Candidatus Saccharimonas aalborgensis TaxID=1332188 RepID=R4PUI5_9BACT|nr:transketolase [Candidatus Saccharimonas aalborgensis]AGL61800.1 transketolase N-terminal domain protein [Candidatus Saccharimonas aalborgensis]QQS68331.1 MAG: transketolase [Candidatus Saccharibacteria bacterium]